MHFFVYLDEFGHIGPFVCRDDPRYKTSPVFGLGGMALPVASVRKFSTYFYKLKCNLLQYEINHKNVQPAKWEKKGSNLYRIENINKYNELRQATNRLCNTIKRFDGFIFYNGIEKEDPSPKHTPECLYISILKNSLSRLNNFFKQSKSTFSLFLDAIDNNNPGDKRKFRIASIELSSILMFGSEHCVTLLEPPYQLESHLYQNLQCADWLCALLGRRHAYTTRPREYPENACVETFFGSRLDSVLKAHHLKRRQTARIISLPNADA